MPTAYSPPDPAELALALEGAQFQHTSQQPIFAAYAAGEIGIEGTIFRLVQEVRQRAPQEAAQRAEEAAHRAEQARIEAEMTANDTAEAPTFVPVVVSGKTLSQDKPPLTVLEPAISTAAIPDAEEPSEADDSTQSIISSFDDIDTWGPGTSTGDEEENDNDLRGDD